jgi:hypothetical protein
MSEKTDYEDRKTLVHLLNSGKTPRYAAEELKRSVSWAYKWRDRFGNEGWEGLHSRSRAPKHSPTRTPKRICHAVLALRSELEAAAEEKDSLGYIGANAIYGQLKAQGMGKVPSIPTIERILRKAGKTKPHLPQTKEEVLYPHLKPTKAHKLTQVDIVPHYLTGGQSIACFNCIDVVSRYPAGKQFAQKRSVDACDFTLHIWRELGLSTYLQMDNESCFNGGYKHPNVIGKVVRLILYVGVQPVFSPYYHPKSNAFVERLHQDYSNFVWEKEHLEDLAAVRQRSALFFPNYRRSHHHSALNGSSPLEIHRHVPARKLPFGFSPPNPLPITAGQVHFLRVVDHKRSVSILNNTWAAGLGVPEQGVWATVLLKPGGATLSIYDAAPDERKRRCLAKHPFELKEPVVPLETRFAESKISEAKWWQALLDIFKRPVLDPSTMS